MVPEDELSFATVGVGDPAPAAQSFTITGSNMTKALSLGSLTNFTTSVTEGSLSPSEGSISATVTVTPKSGFTADAGDKSETLTISGDDLDADIELALNAEVKAKHTVTWNNHGLISTSQVYEGEKPVFPETPTSCDATSTTFIGWATENWTGRLADLAGKTVYTSAAEMPAVTGPVEYFAVYAMTTAGDEEEHEGPSFSRSGSNDTYTTGYTFSAQAEGKTGYYQDGSGDLRYIQVLNATTPIFSATPNRVTVTAKIGGGTGGKDLTDPVQAQLLDNTGAPITGAVVAITSHITTATGDTYADIEIPTAGITSAYGVRISHQKQSSYNVRYYSFSLKYYTGGATYSDYMTTCAPASTCEAPSFSPAAGTFDVAQDITLKTSTPSAHIYYTLDGTDPDNGSAKYSTPIHITQNTTIKAITYADGLTESSISEGVFNIRCAQPTFSLEEGEYTTAQNVTISAEGADAIYFTLNGNDPVPGEEGTYENTEAISINTPGSHTIKAIAVKAGYANSNVASATYVMDLPYGSIAEFIDGAPTAAAKDLVFEAEDNCVITGINGTTIYIQDASGKGIMIFGLSPLPTNAAVNHQITGTINAKYTSFKGQHEMTNVDFSGASISEDPVSRPTPAAVTAIDATNFNEHTMVLVSIENLYYKSSSDKTHKFATAGGSTEYTIYDQFGMMSDKTMPETSVACNLTGILSVYNTTYQLLPVFATDIVADADAAAPVFTPAGGADAENAVTAAAVEITAAAGTKVDGLASKTVDINSVIPTEVSVEVTRDFYRSVNYSCGWYKAAAAKYNINGQGETTEGTVVAKVAGVEAATAAEGDEVHVFITPNAHFHLATILVNDGAIATTMVSEGAEYSFEMPGGAVTIAVTWTEDAKYALTFTAGEGSGDAPAISGNEYYAGEVIQLPANTFTYDAQHKFTKWLIGGTEYAAGVEYTMPAAPAEAVAQWKEIPNFANGDWILVKDAAELSEGSYVIIASANAKVAMKSYASGNNCKGKGDAEKSGDLLTYDSDYGVFEIGDYEISEGTYKTFFDVETEQYLFLDANSNQLKAKNAKDANAAWTITSVSTEGVAVVKSKSYNTRTICYNSNSTLFACYTGGQGDVAFYKYHVPSLKLSYDANAGGDAVTNLPGMQIADNENKVTVSSETPLRESYIFNGWKDGESNDHAAGDVITLSENMTLYAQWRTPNTYSISYDANGGTLIGGESEITPTSVTEGNAYTIEENVYEVEGKLFIGWKANGVTYNAGQEIYPTENMTFVAQWGDPNVTDFMLVTDVKQLKEGDKVYIVAADYNVAMGTQHGTDYRN